MAVGPLLRVVQKINLAFLGKGAPVLDDLGNGVDDQTVEPFELSLRSPPGNEADGNPAANPLFVKQLLKGEPPVAKPVSQVGQASPQPRCGAPT